MPRHRFDPPRGRLEHVRIDSAAVRGNLLGDPSLRTVAVYLPPGYDEAKDERYPLLVGLAGFTGSGLKMLGWQAFGESLPQRLDRLADEGFLGRCILALPDCFTSLGGNQYIDSPAVGNWSEFLLDEMLPLLEKRYRVKPGPGHRAVFGKSSGGYGALIQALRFGDRWAAAACHSADIGFDVAFRRDLPKVFATLARFDHDPVRFVEHVHGATKIAGEEMYALMFLAFAATYDPDPTAPLGVRYPADPHTCALIPERWERWLRHDPLVLLREARCVESLKKLKGLFLDCGSRDEYHLQYGARAFVRGLEAAGVEHVYEEFDDTHSGIDYRLDRSLPFLWSRIAG